MRHALLWLSLLLTSICYADPLPLNDAFSLQASVRDANTVVLHWHIAKGYQLYRHHIAITSADPAQLTVGRYDLPPGISKHDAQLGDYEVYQHDLQLDLPVLGNQSGTANLLVNYQGCSEDGFCYPPTAKMVQLTIADDNAVSAIMGLTDVTITSSATAVGQAHNLLQNHNILLILLGFFGFGLLLSLTPCILPMVPILSGIIVGQGAQITTRRAFLLSLTYVLSMATTYAALGVVMALIGLNIQVSLQNPWVLSVFAALFVVLAISMFGYFELRLPASLQNKLNQLSTTQTSGTYLGVAVMGVLATLIVSPCVTPPLVGTLSFIANTGNALLGGSALFCLGLGMGMPLLLIGTSSGSLIPRAGAWMILVKNVFGVMLLLVAIYLLDRIVPTAVTLTLLTLVAAGSAIYLATRQATTSWYLQRARQGISLLLLAYSAVLATGAATGADDVLHPLAHLTAPTANNPALIFKPVKSVADVQRELQQAKGKPVMLDFYADWCLGCKIMARTTLRDAEVMSKLKQVIILQADVSANDAVDRQLQQHFDVVAPPTFIFFDDQGSEATNARIVGEVSAPEFMECLQQVSR